MVVELQRVKWDTEAGNLPCWWGGTVPVEPGDEVLYYESPTVMFFHGVVGKEVTIPTMTRVPDG